MEPPKNKLRSGSEKRQRGNLTIRLDEAERAKLKTRAGDRALSLAAYIRLCALGDSGPRARRRAPVNGELLARANADLNRIGNNLNQIARVLNRKESVAMRAIEATTAELLVCLAAVRRAAGYDPKG
jgi:Bacterial mobilisation protein (MobC)